MACLWWDADCAARVTPQGRFSGRLETKSDEKRLAEECKLLGPLLGGVGKRGEKSRLTLAKIVRGIASGEVRRYCEAREAELQVAAGCLTFPQTLCCRAPYPYRLALWHQYRLCAWGRACGRAWTQTTGSRTAAPPGQMRLRRPLWQPAALRQPRLTTRALSQALCARWHRLAAAPGCRWASRLRPRPGRLTRRAWLSRRAAAGFPPLVLS